MSYFCLSALCDELLVGLPCGNKYFSDQTPKLVLRGVSEAILKPTPRLTTGNVEDKRRHEVLAKIPCKSCAAFYFQYFGRQNIFWKPNSGHKALPVEHWQLSPLCNNPGWPSRQEPLGDKLMLVYLGSIDLNGWWWDSSRAGLYCLWDICRRSYWFGSQLLRAILIRQQWEIPMFCGQIWPA